MDRLFADIKFALYSMVRAPMIFVLAIVSLGVGVAANTTIFSALDAFLIRPLPYADANNLAQVWMTNPERGWDEWGVSPPDYLDMRDRSRTLDLAAYAGGSMNVSGGETPERLQGVRVTANLFRVLAVAPRLGRSFTPDEDRTGGDKVVIISHGLWQRRLAGAPGALGSTLLLNGEPHTIIGVMPEDFHFPNSGTDIYTALRPSPTALRGDRWLDVLGRTRPNTTIEAAGTEMSELAKQLEAEHPASNVGMGARAVRLDHAMFNATFRTASTICMVAVIFVLLIACSNIANLLLARAATREREIALRSVLGAGRWRVVMQLLTESLVLALMGGALGWLMSIWGVKGLISILPPNFDMVERIGLDHRALVFTLVVSIVAGLAFGLAPALHAARPDLSTVLRDAGGRGSIGGGRAGRLRSSFVVAEIGLALVLLICAGLLIKGSRKNTHADLGFNPDQLLTMRLQLPETAYPDSIRVLAFQDQLLARLGTLPGVKQATVANSLPLQGGPGTTYITADTRALPESQRPNASWRFITPGFFKTLEAKQDRGRDFTQADRLGAVPVAIINQTLAKKHWKDSSPLGQQIEVQGVQREIVGVVSDVLEYGGGNEPPPMIYVPLAQIPVRAVTLAVRSALPVEAVVAPLRKMINSMDANLPVYDVKTMNDRIRDWDGGDRVLAQLLSIFAGIALMLAVLGVYGVMAYNVAQRTQEVGIRMAIGAQPGDIVRLIVRHGSFLAGTGVVIGLALALAVARFLAAFLNGVSPYDATTFAMVPIILFAVGIVASYIPARRATRIDPLIALRQE
jgi:putative ABC transport system permease protein